MAMPLPQSQPSLGLSITNPLVLYRALLSTKKIRPDPAQHRLALQLQKLYFRLKDYDPDTEFRYRLDRAARLARKSTSAHHPSEEARKAVFDDQGRGRARRWFQGNPSDALGLVRTIPVTENALEIDSPQGMLLYGEVGRGKSMLLDLLYDALPTKKKRRWHFNTFMLDIFRRLELARIERLSNNGPLGALDHDHVVLALARETMETSPILFLDEFQLPDRVAGKLVNGFLISFFSLGGVLVASSNRMPEELAKAQGMEFRRLGSNMHGEGRLWWQLRGGRRSEGERAAAGDFGVFVEVLKKRCEVWEMEGERDWRRDWESIGEVGYTGAKAGLARGAEGEEGDISASSTADEEIESAPSSPISIDPTNPTTDADSSSLPSSTSSDTPLHYHVSISAASPSEPMPEPYLDDLKRLNPSLEWVPTTLTVYARKIHLAQTCPSSNPSKPAAGGEGGGGIALLPFPTICATNLGPADYISICSSFHTLVITSVPVLTTLQKNEARRFITLLDACYEARCRLLIEAAAPPDRLFFPETRRRRRRRRDNEDNMASAGSSTHDGNNDNDNNDENSDSIESEAFSEMYQESTAPFRPNVSSYKDSNESNDLFLASSTKSIFSPNQRSILADEDADFGPTYGNGRGHGVSDSSFHQHGTDDGIDDEMSGDRRRARERLETDDSSAVQQPPGFDELDRRQGPDFTQTSALTGADERFAYKRARSRLWEMCGRKWWAQRDQRDPSEWWVPVNREGRFWEERRQNHRNGVAMGTSPLVDQEVLDVARRNVVVATTTITTDRPGSSVGGSGSESGNARTASTGMGVHTAAKNDDRNEGMFRHGASPFRTVAEPPPRFGWQHAWGMMTWGKKAGDWGKGVDGERVKERRQQKTEKGGGEEGGER